MIGNTLIKTGREGGDQKKYTPSEVPVECSLVLQVKTER